MRTALLMGALVLVFAAAIAAQDYLALEIAGAISIFIGLVLIRDINNLKQSIEHLAAAGLEKRSLKRYSQRFGLQEYSQSESALMLLEQKMRLLEASQSCTNVHIDSSQIFPELNDSTEILPQPSLRVHERVADFCRREFGGDYSAIISKQSGSLLTFVALANCTEKKLLKAALLDFFAILSCQSSKTIPNVYFSACKNPELPYFHALGLRYFITASFSDAETDEPAYLWLGFKHQRPSPETLAAIKCFCVSLTHELPKLRRIYENSPSLFEKSLTQGVRSGFLAQVSHDIKSPLNNIRSILNLMRVGTAEADKAELLEVGLHNCEAVAELVESILDFHTFQSGKLFAQPEFFDLLTLAHEVIHIYTIAARLKGLEIRWGHRVDTAPVFADRKQVKRVISNLLSNAIKYTSHGFIEISILELGRQVFELAVKDSGIGIKKSQIAGLFKPFTRFSKGLADGAGLGLTLSKILMELNKGEISVESTPLKGSRFSIRLPALSLETPKTICAQKSKSSSHTLKDKYAANRRCQNFPKLRVLLVDDDPECVESLARNIESDICSVLKATSVLEARQFLNFESPDAIITDEIMPEGGASRILHTAREKGISVPCALLTGNGLSAEQHCRNFKIDKVFQKPVDIKELKSWIMGLSNSNPVLA